MIKPMMVGFSLIGDDATLSDGCRLPEHLHSFREVKCLQDYSKTIRIYI